MIFSNVIKRLAPVFVLMGLVGVYGSVIAQTRGTAASGQAATSPSAFNGSGFGNRSTSFAGPSAFGNNVFAGSRNVTGSTSSATAPGAPGGGLGIGIAGPGVPINSQNAVPPGGSIVGPGSLAPGAQIGSPAISAPGSTVTSPGVPPPGSPLPGNTALSGAALGGTTSTTANANTSSLSGALLPSGPSTNLLTTGFINPAFVGMGGPVTFLPIGAVTSSDAPEVIAANGNIVSTVPLNQAGPLVTNQTFPATSNVYSPYYASPYATGVIGSPTMLLTPTVQGNGIAGQTGKGPDISTAPANPFRSAGQITVSTSGARPESNSESANPGNSSSGGRRAEVQTVLDRSSKIQSKSTILVGVEGGSLVLRGIVKNDHERRLAEAIARLTPGVRDLRNELAVRTEAIAAEANP